MAPPRKVNVLERRPGRMESQSMNLEQIPFSSPVLSTHQNIPDVHDLIQRKFAAAQRTKPMMFDDDDTKTDNKVVKPSNTQTPDDTENLLAALKEKLQAEKQQPHDKTHSHKPIESFNDVNASDILRLMGSDRPRIHRVPVSNKTTNSIKVSTNKPEQTNVITKLKNNGQKHENTVTKNKPKPQRVVKERETAVDTKHREPMSNINNADIVAARKRMQRAKDKENAPEWKTEEDTATEPAETNNEREARMRLIRIAAKQKRELLEKKQKEEEQKRQEEIKQAKLDRERNRKEQLKIWRQKQKEKQRKQKEADLKQKEKEDEEKRQQRLAREKEMAEVKVFMKQKKAKQQQQQNHAHKDETKNDAEKAQALRLEREQRREEVKAFMNSKKEKNHKQNVARNKEKEHKEKEKEAKLRQLYDFHKNVRGESKRDLSNVAPRISTHRNTNSEVKHLKPSHTSNTTVSNQKPPAPVHIEEESEQVKNNRDLQKHLTIWPSDVDLFLKGTQTVREEEQFVEPVKPAPKKRTKTKKTRPRIYISPTTSTQKGTSPRSPSVTPKVSNKNVLSTHKTRANIPLKTRKRPKSAAVSSSLSTVAESQGHKKKVKTDTAKDITTPVPITSTKQAWASDSEEEKEKDIADHTSASPTDLALLQLQNRLGEMVQVAQALHRQNQEIHNIVETKRQKTEEKIQKLQRTPLAPVYPVIAETPLTTPPSKKRRPKKLDTSQSNIQDNQEGPLSPVSFKLRELKKTTSAFSERFAKFLHESEEQKKLNESSIVIEEQNDKVQQEQQHEQQHNESTHDSSFPEVSLNHHTSYSASEPTQSFGDDDDYAGDSTATVHEGLQTDREEEEATLDTSMETETQFDRELLQKLDSIDSVFETERWAIQNKDAQLPAKENNDMYDYSEDVSNINDDSLVVEDVEDDNKDINIDQANILFDSLAPTVEEQENKRKLANSTKQPAPIAAYEAIVPNDKYSVVNIFAKRVMERRAAMDALDDDIPLEEETSKQEDETNEEKVQVETPPVDMEQLMSTIRAHVKEEMAAALREHNIAPIENKDNSSDVVDDSNNNNPLSLIQNKYDLQPIGQTNNETTTTTYIQEKQQQQQYDSHNTNNTNDEDHFIPPSELDRMYMAESKHFHDINDSVTTDIESETPHPTTATDNKNNSSSKSLPPIQTSYTGTYNFIPFDKNIANEDTDVNNNDNDEAKLTAESLESALMKELMVLDKLEESRFALAQMEQSKALQAVERETQVLASMLISQQQTREQVELIRLETEAKKSQEQAEREQIREEAHAAQKILEEQLNEARESARIKTLELEEELRRTKDKNQQKELERAQAEAARNNKLLLAQAEEERKHREHLQAMYMEAVEKSQQAANNPAMNAQYDRVVHQLSDLHQSMRDIQAQVLSQSQKKGTSSDPISIKILNMPATLSFAPSTTSTSSSTTTTAAATVAQEETKPDVTGDYESYDDTFESFHEDKDNKKDIPMEDSYYESTFDTFEKPDTVSSTKSNTTIKPPSMESLESSIEFDITKDENTSIEIELEDEQKEASGTEIEFEDNVLPAIEKDEETEIEFEDSVVAPVIEKDEETEIEFEDSVVAPVKTITTDIESEVEIEIEVSADDNNNNQQERKKPILQSESSEVEIEISGSEQSETDIYRKQDEMRKISSDDESISIEVEVSDENKGNKKKEESSSISISLDDEDYATLAIKSTGAKPTIYTTTSNSPKLNRIGIVESTSVPVIDQKDQKVAIVSSLNIPPPAKLEITADPIIVQQFQLMDKRRIELNKRTNLQRDYLLEKQRSSKPYSSQRYKFEEEKINKMYNLELAEIERSEAQLREQQHRFELQNYEQRGTLYESRKKTHNIKKKLASMEAGEEDAAYDSNDDITASSMTAMSSLEDEEVYDHMKREKPLPPTIIKSSPPSTTHDTTTTTEAPVSIEKKSEKISSSEEDISIEIDASVSIEETNSVDFVAEGKKLKQQEADIASEKQYLKDLLSRRQATSDSTSIIKDDNDSTNQQLKSSDLSFTMSHLLQKPHPKHHHMESNDSGNVSDVSASVSIEGDEILPSNFENSKPEQSNIYRQKDVLDIVPLEIEPHSDAIASPSTDDEATPQPSDHHIEEKEEKENVIMTKKEKVTLSEEITEAILEDVTKETLVKPFEITISAPSPVEEIKEEVKEEITEDDVSIEIEFESEEKSEEEQPQEQEEKEPVISTYKPMTKEEKEKAADAITDSILSSLINKANNDVIKPKPLSPVTVIEDTKKVDKLTLQPTWDNDFSKKMKKRDENITQITEDIFVDVLQDTLLELENVYWIRKSRVTEHQKQQQQFGGLPMYTNVDNEPEDEDYYINGMELSGNSFDDSFDDFDNLNDIDLTHENIREFSTFLLDHVTINWNISSTESDEDVIMKQQMNKALEEDAKLYPEKRVTHQLLASTLTQLIHKLRRGKNVKILKPWQENRSDKTGRVYLQDHYWKEPTKSEIIKKLCAEIETSLNRTSDIVISLRNVHVKDADALLVDRICRKETDNDEEMREWSEEALYPFEDEVVFELADAILQDMFAEIVIDLNAIETKKILRNKTKRVAAKKARQNDW